MKNSCGQPEIDMTNMSEQTLKDNFDMLNRILASSPVGLGVIKDRRVKWINAAMCRMFQIESSDEFKDQKALGFLSSTEEYRRVGQMIIAKLSDGKPAEEDVLLRRKDGTTFFGHVKMTCKDPLKPLASAVIAVSDISWRKQAEEDRLQREKLQGVVELAGAMCHELNQPLQVIMGSMELLKRDIQNGMISDKRMVEIERQVEKMGQITHKFDKITRYKIKKYVKETILDVI
jgi:PAS domain S-box-containing protein